MENTFAVYQPSPELRDEAVGVTGAMEPHWQYLMSSLSALGEQELKYRQQRARQILRSDGASYRIYSESQQEKTWPLDLIPWLIHSEEWRRVEAGIQERAELFNLIYQDLYGPRELILRGIVPPELLLGHKGFLRSCDNIQLPGDHQIIMHAVDMMRSEDGGMCVLADRTQAPSGAGYALENRNVMWKVLPSLFRDSHVHQLTRFFQTLRQKLITLAPEVKSPRIAVLTPGAFNETYFEHVYLANYLGFHLVQSSDLQVHNGYVWIKSVSEPVKVDVILRRVDDRFCDPVELKSDSQLGVPGLLQVVREGKVVIANPLGSAALENPALLNYLPQISQHFFGRALKLNSVQTWWCGDTENLAYVLSNIDSLIVKPIFRGANVSSTNMAECTQHEREEIIAKILQKPNNYVAQEKLKPSHMPVMSEQSLISRPVVLRSYAVAGEASYRVMPGGLTRVGIKQHTSLIASQLGSYSKDTWVIASEPEKQQLAFNEITVHVDDIDRTDLPTRVAENLFWMGRYLERADSLLRLMRTILSYVLGVAPLSPKLNKILLESVTRQSYTYPGFVDQAEKLEQPMPELASVMVDLERQGSLNFSVRSVVRCAEEAKEYLSLDSQRIIYDMQDQMVGLEHHLENSVSNVVPEDLLNNLITYLIALSGSIEESMVRGSGWHFFNLGQKLERGLQTTNLMQSMLLMHKTSDQENVAWEAMLTTIEGLYSYRRIYGAELLVKNILQHILLDNSNPRAVIYQLELIQNYYDKLSMQQSNIDLDDEQRSIIEAINLMRLVNFANFSANNTDNDYFEINQTVNRVQELLRESSDLLMAKFFAPGNVAQQLIDERWSLD